MATLKKEGGAAKGLMTRDVHAKAHGCVRGTFTINADVPAEYRAGVFADPGKEYAAWIRFSNGSSKIQADKKGDARGMAIKLMGVEGGKLLDGETKAETQDFLLISHDAFFVKDGKDYAEFFRLIAKGSNPAWFFFGRLPWRWTEFTAASQLIKKGKSMKNPLFFRYFSATPYLLGEKNIVKYSVEPCAANPDPLGRFGDSPDSLRLNMAKSLDVREGKAACFRFMVQRRSDPGTMSVEDSRIPWDRARSPFTPVATVTIPVQDFSSEKRMRFCEDLSFTPWHSLPAHRPLGGINRTRKVVYEAVSAFRHEANHASRREPGADAKPE
ncbi:MAG: catalase family protein [Elusimicrobia bacterium]|nr:catalase family protein [Elusimicrobiota bacterium]